MPLHSHDGQSAKVEREYDERRVELLRVKDKGFIS